MKLVSLTVHVFVINLLEMLQLNGSVCFVKFIQCYSVFILYFIVTVFHCYIVFVCMLMSWFAFARPK